MTKFYAAKIQTNDAKAKGERRFRNIVAASGKILEDGEIRDIERLYVMGRDGKLIKVSDLAKDPEKQTQTYKVNFAENHGHYDPVTGERVVEVEDVLGDAKVWLDTDGVHARVYFANDDPKADHAWAISDNASYSTGIEWYPDGYYGADNDIDEPIGVLREISIVPTGNDPRARTIDTKSSKGTDGAAVGDKKLNKKGTQMSGTKKSIDALTPDERAAMQREMSEAVDSIIDKFTTSAPESETEPTARDTKDEVNDAEGVKKKEELPLKDNTKDTYHMPVLVINDRKEVARQETDMKKTTDWRFSKDAVRKFADYAKQYGGFRHGFVQAWQDELKKHGATTNDGITNLGLPVDTRALFIDALEKSDGIISHFDELGGKSYLIRLLTAEDGIDAETARAGGFKKGDEKIFQKLLATPRRIYNKMVYKMLDIDALELYENPELIRTRARELVQALIVEVERAGTIGDGRSAPTGDNPDRRMFDGERGFFSILADAQATEGFGQLMATSVTLPAGSNLYDASIEAENAIEADGGLIYITKKSVIKSYRQAKNTLGEPLVTPGVKLEDILGAERIYAPSWMEKAPVDVIVFANKSYGLIGESNPTMRPEFDVRKNLDILLAEFPRGGSLKAYKAAVAITFSNATASALSAQAGDAPVAAAKTSTRSDKTTTAKTAAAKTSTENTDTAADNKNDEQTK